MTTFNGLSSNPPSLHSRFKETVYYQPASLGVPGTLLIDLTMKSPSRIESVYPGLVIGKHLIDSLLFHYSKTMYKIFKI